MTSPHQLGGTQTNTDDRLPQDLRNAGPPHLSDAGSPDMPGDDPASWWRVVDRLSFVFTESGLPRMAGRVFAYVLVNDAEGYSARELADALHVSPAAVSTAVRQLVRAGMLTRVREPGSRADHYRVRDDDVWWAIFQQRDAVIQRHEHTLREGAATLAPSTGARRLLESAEFIRFSRLKAREMMQRWNDHRRALGRHPDTAS
ncbi:GbsR/MarR family transcriptional regulator [Phytoactinopolyspora limicola]|uniref:GbsR/MarR family transcriptional regulator n=1 Tax=Phytoactinopolyspora limicola TaxID=2715536 RepID=UPI001A9C288A|nr:MarR family transcriptional regulator [Phytoactinopolyspora limicola]